MRKILADPLALLSQQIDLSTDVSPILRSRLIWRRYLTDGDWIEKTVLQKADQRRFA